MGPRGLLRTTVVLGQRVPNDLIQYKALQCAPRLSCSVLVTETCMKLECDQRECTPEHTRKVARD